jgi:uncharacterized protein
VAGLFSVDVVYTAAALLPVMVFGLWLGHRLHVNMSREQLVRIIGTVLTASGASLLIRAVVTA